MLYVLVNLNSEAISVSCGPCLLTSDTDKKDFQRAGVEMFGIWLDIRPGLRPQTSSDTVSLSEGDTETNKPKTFFKKSEPSFWFITKIPQLH